MIIRNDLENLLNLDGETFPMDIVPYEFESASQLLEDFWKSAEYYMENNR